MKWWAEKDYAWRLAAIFIGAASAISASGLIANRARNWDAWIPSLVCNLFTTGLTIYFVNVALVRREREQHDRTIKGVIDVVMKLVQPQVHSLLRRIVDPSLRLGPVGGSPDTWEGLSKAVKYKLDTYQSTLDVEVTESLERICTCLGIMAMSQFDVDHKSGALHDYMTLGPLVRHLDKLRKRFFPAGSELLYGGMVSLIEEFRQKYNFPVLPDP